MQNVIQWDLNSFFSKNLQKSLSSWGLCPQTPIVTGGLGLRPQTPSAMRLSTLAYSTRFLSSTFTLLTISFCPLPLPKSWLSAIRLRLQIFHSTISLPNKKFLFRKFLMTSLHVICGLGPPQLKILAAPMTTSISF